MKVSWTVPYDGGISTILKAVLFLEPCSMVLSIDLSCHNRFFFPTTNSWQFNTMPSLHHQRKPPIHANSDHCPGWPMKPMQEEKCYVSNVLFFSMGSFKTWSQDTWKNNLLLNIVMLTMPQGSIFWQPRALQETHDCLAKRFRSVAMLVHIEGSNPFSNPPLFFWSVWLLRGRPSLF